MAAGDLAEALAFIASAVQNGVPYRRADDHRVS
jgi:hypothetical protein